jgi:hypothetical protein
VSDPSGSFEGKTVNRTCLGFEVFTAVTVESTAIRVVTPCSHEKNSPQSNNFRNVTAYNAVKIYATFSADVTASMLSVVP